MQKTQLNKALPWLVFGSIVMLTLSFGVGIMGGFLGNRLAGSNGPVRGTTITNSQNVEVLDQSSAIIDVAEKSSPSVVSIIVTQDLPVYENYFYNPFGDDDLFGLPGRRQVGTERQEVGAGTGFIISADGLILTNRHVVSNTDADYSIVLNDGSTFDAKVLARDTVLDVAIVKIDAGEKKLTPLPLGDSNSIKIGQTAIAIGNSLGRFSNTVSAGIISGLDRTITASSRDGLDAQQLDGVLQTDASINPGNSGGPLLDVAGNVIAVNVAIAADAENVGFAIPINLVKPIVTSVQQFGEIRRPYLGVRYVQITAELAKEENLSVENGALIRASGNSPAVIAGSPAAKAGLKAGDIITKVNSIELKQQTTLQTEIQKYSIGDTVSITFWRDGKEQTVDVKLEQLREE